MNLTDEERNLIRKKLNMYYVGQDTDETVFAKYLLHIIIKADGRISNDYSLSQQLLVELEKEYIKGNPTSEQQLKETFNKQIKIQKDREQLNTFCQEIYAYLKTKEINFSNEFKEWGITQLKQD